MQQASQPSGVLPRIMVQYKRELLWAVVTLALLLPLGYAAKVRADAAADARQGVVLSAPGVVTVPHVQLMSEVPGVVREVPAKGARVTQGQPLARLEDLDLEAAVVSARLELEAARAGLVKAQTPVRSEELEDLDAAIELATIALDSAQKATDSLHAGINAASAPRQDLQAVLNEELKAIQAKADQTPAPHHASAAPAADPAGGHVHPQAPADPAPPAEEDCEVHQQLRELTRLFETVIVRAAAADQPVSAARDTTLMEQLMAQVEIAKVNLRQAIAKKARVTAAPPPENGVEAHAKVQRAQTALTLAERKLQKTSVVAPVTGTVVEVAVAPGTPVNIGQPLAVLSNDANTQVSLRVRAKSAGPVKTGEKALVMIGERSLTGKVTTIDLDAGGELATITVTLERLEQRIPDGAQAQVKIIADSPTHP